jgi:hypothetical protein
VAHPELADECHFLTDVPQVETGGEGGTAGEASTSTGGAGQASE